VQQNTLEEKKEKKKKSQTEVDRKANPAKQRGRREEGGARGHNFSC